jgi:hypothetical protein
VFPRLLPASGPDGCSQIAVVSAQSTGLATAATLRADAGTIIILQFITHVVRLMGGAGHCTAAAAEQ